jgi:hypothetical protein
MLSRRNVMVVAIAGLFGAASSVGVRAKKLSPAARFDTDKDVVQGFRERRSVRACVRFWAYSDRRLSGRRVLGEVADIEHCPQQLGLGRDGLRLRHQLRDRMLAAGNVIVEQRLDLRHALADRIHSLSYRGVASLWSVRAAHATPFLSIAP